MNSEQVLGMGHVMAMQPRGIWHIPSDNDTGRRAGELLPLALLSTGASGRISFLRGSSETIRHLTELGFVEGAEIKVVSGNLGNLIIELKGSRLAIGRQTATHIVVTK